MTCDSTDPYESGVVEFTVMTHIYGCGSDQTSPGNWQPAEPTRPLKISSSSKPTTVLKPTRFCAFARHSPSVLRRKRNLTSSYQAPWRNGRAGGAQHWVGHGAGARRGPVSVSARGTRPPSSPTITAPVSFGCRSNLSEKKSAEAPAGHYRLGEFPGECAPGPRSLTDIGQRMSAFGGRAEVNFKRLNVCF